MQFSLDKNYKAPKLYNQLLSGFRGVDFTNATLSIAANRSPNATNWIYRDGLNQKRNGYTQVAFKNGKINGYWEFKDSNLNVHRIMQVGKEFYKVTIDATKVDGATYTRLYPNAYVPSYYASQELSDNYWSLYISDNLRDEKSYGVVRGDRLYIFAGVFLVYGSWDDGTTWQLRAVRDNSDTYIPVVTTNIDYEGYEGKTTRSALEDINMMSCRRRARIISPQRSEAMLEITDDRDDSIISNTDTYWSNYTGIIVPIKIETNTKYLGVVIDVFDDEDERHSFSAVFGDTNRSQINYNGNQDNIDAFNQEGYGVIFDRYQIFRTPKFSEGKTTYEYKLILGMQSSVASDYSFKVYLNGVASGYKYVIDKNGIDSVKAPIVKYISTGSTINGVGQLNWDYTNGTITFNYFDSFKYNKTHTPDIEIEYSPKTASTDYQKIDGCRFGCIFGYNAIEHLFVSGNSNYPNVDWHTNESFFDNNSNIPDTQNLTYWSDLSYEYLGGQQSAIKSYIVLSDNTLAILKEELPHENTLYIRSPYMAAAITYDGETVRDSEGNAYQKLYYTTAASAMGIGCLSTFATANYDGDKMFLAKTGIYGIEIGDNSASAFNIQRFARRRSFYINPKLTAFNENILKKACAIVYDGKYFLALNDSEGTVYIADKVDNNDTNYTHVYEWYVWKGIKANSFFIDIDNKLGFTTDDGRICKFLSKDVFRDRDIDLFDSLSAEVGQGEHTFTTFTTNATDLDKVASYSKIKIKNNNLYELLVDYGGIIFDSNTEKYRVSEDAFLYFIQYYEGDTLYLCDGQNQLTEITISDLDSSDYSFNINGFSDDIERFCLIAKLDEEYALVDVQEGNNSNYTFKIQARNGVDYADLFFTTQNIASLNLKDTICLIKDRPVVARWYTPIMNMGDSNYAKTLKYFTIIPERYLRGTVNMSFITLAKETNINIEGLDYLESLDNVDLDTITVDPINFAKSFSKKYQIRNFNFLQVLFESSNASNAGLHNMSLTYVVTKRNRGVK